MRFAAPAALWGLALLLGPVLVHLFSRRRATRRPFPSLRLLEASRLPPVARRTLDDRGLLALRLAILACAVLALARPSWPTAVLASEVERSLVIVEDTAARTRRDLVRAAADSVEAASDVTLRVRTHDPASVLAASAQWLGARGGGDLLVITDGHPDVVRRSDLAALPAAVAVRTIVPTSSAVINATPDTTRVVVDVVGEDTVAIATLSARVSALVPNVTPRVRPAARRVVTAPTRIVSLGASLVDVVEAPLVRELVMRRGWPATAMDAMAQSKARADAPPNANATVQDTTPRGWTVHDPDGRALLTVHDDGAVQLTVHADAAHPVTAALLALTLERVVPRAAPSWRERDAAPIDASVLASLQRPASAPAGRFAQAALDDAITGPPSWLARWLWVLALVGLLAEGWWRRRLAASRTTHDAAGVSSLPTTRTEAP